MKKNFVAEINYLNQNQNCSFIRLKNGAKMPSLVEAAVKGFQHVDVACVVVLKQVAGCRYKTMARIYPSGEVENLENVCERPWAIFDSEIKD